MSVSHRPFASTPLRTERKISPSDQCFNRPAGVRLRGHDLLSYCNNTSLRKAARCLGKLYDGVLEPSGLKATQCILLTQIYDLGSPTMAKLANGLLMDLSATRHSLGPLIRESGSAGWWRDYEGSRYSAFGVRWYALRRAGKLLASFKLETNRSGIRSWSATPAGP
jgi:hypothetical protein